MQKKKKKIKEYAIHELGLSTLLKYIIKTNSDEAENELF